ncbi:MAG TPA: hypothetical protein VEJ23_01655, partial [Solirubrobacteraceae bacterium]|nr:hypothetical protein [Solirubrobacteraceae bacterium]
AALLLLSVLLAACGASAQTTDASTRQRPAGSEDQASIAATAEGTAALPGAAHGCGAAGPETLAQTAGQVAIQIYDRELASSEVSADQRQVESYAPLLSALASGNRAGVQEAVTSLVFSHTHVVRLRVTQGGQVLADVGGPYIIAPVGGSLRLHGRTVGQYVLSVQDDLGYVKLETRFIGVPLLMRSDGVRIPVEGTLAPGPASIPDHGPVTYQGVFYQAFSFSGKAFPSGQLRISLLLPLPGGLATTPCASIRIDELNHIAQLVWGRFIIHDGAPPSAFVDAISSLTGGLGYVRAGSHQVAGSTTPGPRRLPDSGPLSYHGHGYSVTSFPAPGEAGVRVYLLVRS